MTTYKFIGEGEGVPGLPHEITDEEAAKAGLVDLLKQAIANGNYKAVATVKPSAGSKKESE